LFSLFNNYFVTSAKRLGDNIINVHRNYDAFCIESALISSPFCVFRVVSLIVYTTQRWWLVIGIRLISTRTREIFCSDFSPFLQISVVALFVLLFRMHGRISRKELPAWCHQCWINSSDLQTSCTSQS